jgi:murein DD-endopeptidase MepM/ murein hydrolase activator NlpD
MLFQRKRRLFSPFSVLIILIAIMVIAFYQWTPSSSSTVDSEPYQNNDLVKKDDSADQNNSSHIQSGQIKSGESFYDLMIKNGVSDKEVLAIAASSRKVFNLRKIKAGRPYKIILGTDGKPITFEYQIDNHKELIISQQPNGWSSQINTVEYQIREKVVQGVIQDSLYLSLLEICASSVLAINLADIFAWDIDFGLDLRKGDSFGILYEERWRDGHYIGPGKILATRFINQGKPFDAVYYKDRNGNTDFYDINGHSLQKQFLKSPLQFKYISSYFSRNRLHPILKIRRPHLGVDYAAPRGTPVRAAAEGRIVFKGRKGGMGKMIKIRHSSIYTTAYGHLSRYAKGLKTRKFVKQGEIIGYVGSTGLSTGPHLHYSFYRNGKLIDPTKIKNPRAKSVNSKDLSEFKLIAGRYLERVEPPSYEKLTVSVDDQSRF